MQIIIIISDKVQPLLIARLMFDRDIDGRQLCGTLKWPTDVNHIAYRYPRVVKRTNGKYLVGLICTYTQARMIRSKLRLNFYEV